MAKLRRKSARTETCLCEQKMLNLYTGCWLLSSTGAKPNLAIEIFLMTAYIFLFMFAVIYRIYLSQDLDPNYYLSITLTELLLF